MVIQQNRSEFCSVLLNTWGSFLSVLSRLMLFQRVCLLLAACCLLAKPDRSTLDPKDPKEGYKTKTGSTSSNQD